MTKYSHESNRNVCNMDGLQEWGTTEKMSQPYVKECSFCKEKIRMSEEKGKGWKPYNLDGTDHTCQKKNGNEKLTNGHKEISLELVLKELAGFGITIDLEKLKNVG